MAIWSVAARGLSSAGRWATSSAGRAGLFGLGGGVLLDDVPLIGETLDPTENGNDSEGPDLMTILLLLLVLFVVLQATGGD